MFIHFEDWSHYMNGIDSRIPHQGKVIKAYGTYTDPRDFFQDPDIAVLEFNHDPFLDNEVFSYGSREGYGGATLEYDLSRVTDMDLRFQPEIPLDDIAKETTRAMVRLAHSKEFPAARAAMLARDSDGNWHFNHPFSLFHGFERLTRNPERSMAIHFDIISPQSLDLLGMVFDWREEKRLVGVREGKRIRESDFSTFFPEGNPQGKERF